MKKLISILVLAVAIVATPMAQAELRLGAKLGANVTNFNGDFENYDYSSAQLANFTGGLTVEWMFAFGLGFDVSALYTAKGAQYDLGEDLFGNLGDEIITSVLGAEPKLKNVVHYVEVPINLKYKLSIPVIEDLVIPFIYTGPSFAFKVGEAITFGEKPLDLKAIQIDNSAVDFAWNVGLGAEIIKHLNVAVQYGWGLGKATDIKIANIEDITGDNAIKSGAWTITLGWMF